LRQLPNKQLSYVYGHFFAGDLILLLLFVATWREPHQLAEVAIKMRLIKIPTLNGDLG
jgi:hypothetical protein